MKSLSILLLCQFWVVAAYAQSVVISQESSASPASSAILDVQSTSKGMLVPRMTKSQRDAISSPASGLLIYQSDDSPGFYYYNGSAWEALKSSGGGGGITEETDPQVSDDLTTNAVPVWEGDQLVDSDLYNNDGKVGIGTDSPEEALDVSGSIRASSSIYLRTSGVRPYLVVGKQEGDRVLMSVLDDGTGYMKTRGANGNDNVLLSSTIIVSGEENSNHGYMGVGDSDGSIKAGMMVQSDGSGYLFADKVSTKVKEFVENHPLQPDKQIVYTCVEGPEAAMYMRGTAQLTKGKGTITLPEHYRLLAEESSMTVIVTPLSANTAGLAVTDKSLDGIVVEELMQGTHSYEFDWEVKCVRKGYEDYEVVRDKVNTKAVSASEIRSAAGAGSLPSTDSEARGNE